ncbi:MAG TPA: hypothetical protein VN758_10355 [Solirubrobacterales bacterium]|nr:hypothetical protein [Solirubrobacterales bacterium]
MAKQRQALGELGERPSEPFRREGWDRAVKRIEHYRQEQGITD